MITHQQQERELNNFELPTQEAGVIRFDTTIMEDVDVTVDYFVDDDLTHVREAWIRGVAVLDCLSSKYIKQLEDEADAHYNACLSAFLEP